MRRRQVRSCSRRHGDVREVPALQPRTDKRTRSGSGEGVVEGMRCTATVTEHALHLRSRDSEQDPQCHRSAKIGGLCRQHAAAHAQAVAAHHRVLARILAIPPRD